MKISKLIRISVTLLCTLQSFLSLPSFALTESIPNQQHGDWISFTKELDQQTTSHIASQSADGSFLLIFDFIAPDLYVIELYKDKAEPTQQSEPNFFVSSASFFVDDNLIGNYQSKCAEFEEYYECFLPQPKNDEIVENLKRGNSIRILISGADLNFSLNGFSDAFSRAMELVK